MSRPWGVHAVSSIYHPQVSAGLPDGRVVAAVGEPYHGTLLERIRAAWWVVSGRAYAVVWPDSGDIERALRGD